ncbi:MAG: DUF3052 domain-containing protein [Planctomycetota bacterium]
MPAGYSGTPLVRKLGIKPGMRVRFINPPAGYVEGLEDLPDDVTIVASTRGSLAFIQLFATSAAELRRRLPAAQRAMATDGMVWISWPKRASGVDTDLTGDVVREIGLATGLVDIKVCAVDETWSGLKFVIRRADR